MDEKKNGREMESWYANKYVFALLMFFHEPLEYIQRNILLSYTFLHS